MNEIVNEFKVDLEELMEKLYQDLDKLICDTLVTMSFFEGDEEEHEAILRNALMELCQDKIVSVLEEVES